MYLRKLLSTSFNGKWDLVLPFPLTTLYGGRYNQDQLLLSIDPQIVADPLLHNLFGRNPIQWNRPLVHSL